MPGRPGAASWARWQPSWPLSACSTSSFSLSKPETLFGLLEPYKVDVVQGNVVTREQLAVLRPGMPRAMVRLSAGREEMPESLQSLCFLAGANSMFYGDRLLTTNNPQAEKDRHLLNRLGMHCASEIESKL